MQSGIRLSFVALVGALSTSSCGGLEGDLLDALQAKDQCAFCVQPQVLGVDAFEGNDGKLYVAKAGEVSFMGSGSAVQCLEKLKEEGYVSSDAISLPNGLASSFDAFEITEKGAKYFQPDSFSGSIEACIGEKLAKEVLEYTEPSGDGPRATEARFRYEIEFNGFVDELDIEKVLEEEVNRTWPGEGVAVFTKTNKGWRLEHAMWQ